MANLAQTWLELRSVWNSLDMEYKPEHPLYESLKQLLMQHRPTQIPNPKTDGDSGHVYFADGSCIQWDWDNGDFECQTSEGIWRSYDYPCYFNDPLFWTVDTIEVVPV